MTGAAGSCFRVTLRRLDLAAEIYHNPRRPQKIPLLNEPGRDAGGCLAVASSLKARTLLSLGYGLAGLARRRGGPGSRSSISTAR